MEDSHAPAAEERKWGFIDQSGKTVIAPKFAAVADFSEGLAAVSYKVGLAGAIASGRSLGRASAFQLRRAGCNVYKPQLRLQNGTVPLRQCLSGARFCQLLQVNNFRSICKWQP